MNDLVAAAAASVRRWVHVPTTWADFRPEPLAAERLWAPCSDATDAEPRHQAGLDADGRVVLVGPGDRPPERWTAPPDWVYVIERSQEQRTVKVHAFGRHGAPRVTTRFDEAGRPVSSSYAGGHPDEQYVYDSQQRLVEIVESPGLISLGWAHWRNEDPIGGRIEVLHDELGVRMVRRADSGLVVWERLDRPWREALAGFAAALAEAVVAGVAEASRDAGHGPEEQVFSLALVPYPVGLVELRPLLFAGREADRRQILAHPDENVEEYLWWCQHHDSTSIVGFADLPADLQRAAIRATVMHAPGDPLETLCQAAVPLLAAHGWGGILTPTPDFAVYVIGEDVGAADIYRSMVAGNPASRLAERAARWRGSPYPPEQ